MNYRAVAELRDGRTITCDTADLVSAQYISEIFNYAEESITAFAEVECDIHGWSSEWAGECSECLTGVWHEV